MRVNANVVQGTNMENIRMNNSKNTNNEISSEKKLMVAGNEDKDFTTNDSDKFIQDSLKVINERLKKDDKYISRSVHPGTKAVIYTLKDSKTDEVIEEIPSKKIQDMVSAMWELAGLFIDKKI